MGLKRAALAVAALLLAAGLPAAGSRAAFPGVPSIYVNYNGDCTFSLTVDGGIAVTATSPPGPTLPPGVYQVQVSMPNPSAGYPCGAPTFTLRGPGVNSVTTFPYESIFDNHLLPALQPSSTYVAEDENAPASTHVYFTTAASGSSSSLLPAASGAAGSSKGSSQGDLVGSAASPLRGRLQATVGADGRATLKLGSRNVTVLEAGRYTITVHDGSTAAGFLVRRTGASPLSLTTRAYVGTATRRVTLTAGTWLVEPTTGPRLRFTVVR